MRYTVAKGLLGWSAAPIALLVALAAPVKAQVVWDWSFGSNTGTFTTTGTAPGGVAAPGYYSLIDFMVTASGQGATLGSVSGGQYGIGAFSSTPTQFYWTGSSVSQWQNTGANTWQTWWPFEDLGNIGNYFLFAWATGNVNTADQAAYFPDSEISSTVTVAVAQGDVVPEPASMMLLATGLAGMAATRLKKRNA